MTKKRILCVENNEDICELITTILKNYEIISAKSIGDALYKNAQEKINLILLNYHLPDGTGEEFYVQVKNTAPEIPVLFVTDKTEINEIKAKRIGAHGFINIASKSFVSELKAAVAQLLETKACSQPV